MAKFTRGDRIVRDENEPQDHDEPVVASWPRDAILIVDEDDSGIPFVKLEGGNAQRGVITARCYKLVSPSATTAPDPTRLRNLVAQGLQREAEHAGTPLADGAALVAGGRFLAGEG